MLFSVIDATNVAEQLEGGGNYASFSQFQGPVESGGALWEVTFAANVAHFPIQVQKSTDGGVTWAVQDAANAPFTQSTIGVQAIGTTLYIFYRNFDNAGAPQNTGLRVIPFDLLTATYGAPTADAPNTSGTGTSGVFQAVSAGVFHIVYNISGVTMWFNRYASGAWGTESAVTDVSISLPRITGFARDLVTGTLHWLYSQNQSGGAAALSPNLVQHRSVSSAGTVSGATAAIANADQTTFQSAGNFSTYPGFGQGQAVGSKLFFPSGQFPPAAGGQFPFCLAYSGAAWTLTRIASGNGNSPDVAGTATTISFLDADAVTVHIFWVTRFFNLDDSVTVKHVTTTDGLTFSTPDVIDFGSALPTAPPSFDLTAGGGTNFYNPTCAVLAAGSLAITVQCSAQDFNQYTLFVIALQIACGNPPRGTIGTAYTHTVPAKGGLPPYAFAITAGALPAGLALAGATGIISGTPTTAGAAWFTITVTDADGTTASVNCAIGICPPAGGGGSGNVAY